MNYPLKISLAFLFITISALFIAPQSISAAPSLSLSPESDTTTVGGNLIVDILIDTDTLHSSSVDVVLDFNSDIFQVSQVDFGALYPQTAENINNTAGVIFLGAFFNDPLASFSGSGIFATLTLIGQSPGTSPFTFRCTPDATNDSNITQKDPAQDILDCSSVINGSYQVLEPDAPTPTPGSPTSTPTPSPTPTPGGTGSTPTSTPTPTPTWTSPVESGANTPTPTTSLPETASIAPTLTLAILGATLILGSGILLAL